MSGIRRRAWRSIPLAMLLTLAARMLAVVGVRALRSDQEVRNERRLAAGEAIVARPWMAIPYIVRSDGVPDKQRFAALGLADTEEHRHAPVQAITGRESRDLAADIAAPNASIDARSVLSRAPRLAAP